MAKPILRMIIGRTVGFLIFLILLAIANFFTKFVHIPIYADIVSFFNSSLIILLSMAILGMVNEMFWHFYFPFNVLAPITSAALGVLISIFIYKFWIFINGYLNIVVNIPIQTIEVVIFWIIIIAGYLTMLFRGGKPRYVRDEKYKENKINIKESNENKKRVEWEDVDDEFRLVLYNIGRSINRKFESKTIKSSDKKKKK